MSKSINEVVEERTVTHHLTINVEGILRWNKNMKGLFEDNGRPLSHLEAKKYLLECKAKGWRVIPMSGEPCEGWSYQTGCPGHTKTLLS